MTKHKLDLMKTLSANSDGVALMTIPCADVRALLAEREALLAACQFFLEECPIEHGIENMVLAVPHDDRTEREDYLLGRLAEARAALANGRAGA